MNQISRISILFVSSMILFSCSSKPVEEYKDYFYTSPGEGQNTNFTFILYLGSEGANVSEEINRDPSKVPQRQKVRTSHSKDDNEMMSISFRMEEEAFKRIENLLATKDYCNAGVEYKSNQYTWLRYTITGICKK